MTLPVVNPLHKSAAFKFSVPADSGYTLKSTDVTIAAQQEGSMVLNVAKGAGNPGVTTVSAVCADIPDVVWQWYVQPAR